MKASSNTPSQPLPKQRKKKRSNKGSGKAGATKASERETVFRLSQEFPNSNWLERKINLEIEAVQVRKHEKRSHITHMSQVKCHL